MAEKEKDELEKMNEALSMSEQFVENIRNLSCGVCLSWW